MFPYSSMWQKRKSRRNSKTADSLGGDLRENIFNLTVRTQNLWEISTFE